MPSLRQVVADAVWGGTLPPPPMRDFDAQGWNSEHPYLTDAIDRYRATLVIEIGAWKGASVISLARRMKEIGADGCVLAIDTWQGSAEHWLHREVPRYASGMSALFDVFRSNMVHAGVDDYVVPLPLDSQSAATVVKKLFLWPTVIHLDGSHDYASVRRDLETWWPLLESGGTLIADDYGDPQWPDVKRALDEFIGGYNQIESALHKGRVTKD